MYVLVNLFSFWITIWPFLGKKLSFWLSACTVLIVVPLLKVRHSFPLVSWTEGIRYITKTCLYNFDPLKPHFYIVKLGFSGVYIIFLISAQKINCEYSLELPQRGGSNEYPQSMFRAEI